MKKVISQLIGFCLGACFSFAAIAALKSEEPWIRTPNPDAPRQALIVVIIVVSFAVLQCYGGIQTRRKFGTSPSGRPKLRRLSANMGSRMLATQLMFAVFAFIFANQEGWSTESVGFQSELPVLIALAFGFSIYSLFVMVLTCVLKVFGTLDVTIANNMQVLAFLWPRSSGQRAALLLGICVLNPVLEELLFRGILVHQFSFAIESLALPLFLGLVITLGNHAYQGWLPIMTHLPFYVIAVGLLFSPAGLWGAIGFHLAGDWIPFLGMKRSLQRYREIYRHPDHAAVEKKVASNDGL